MVCLQSLSDSCVMFVPSKPKTQNMVMLLGISSQCKAEVSPCTLSLFIFESIGGLHHDVFSEEKCLLVLTQT